MRRCMVCLDKGLVPFVREERGYPYEYLLRCRCEAGRAWGAPFPPMEEWLDPAEVWKMEEENREYFAEDVGCRKRDDMVK